MDDPGWIIPRISRNIRYVSPRALESYYEPLEDITQGKHGPIQKMRDMRNGEINVVIPLREADDDTKLVDLTARQVDERRVFPSHPRIIQCKEVIKPINGGIYLSMEFMENDLIGFLEQRRRQPLSENEIRKLMQMLLQGVSALHGAGAVHGDVKPANILVNGDGSELKITEGKPFRFTINSAKYVPCPYTLPYRAIEIVKGRTDQTRGGDIWAVGCVLAELTLGRPLFDGVSSELDLQSRIYGVVGIPGKLRQIFHGTALSENGISLLESLLQMEPLVRITADGALRHVWFRAG